MSGPESYHLIVADVMDGLRGLLPESVHCVVTSPPYWGLRRYETPPTIWGGDADHDHAWEATPVREAYSGKRRWQHSVNGRGEDQPDEKRTVNANHEQNQDAWIKLDNGAYCSCGAWRGHLGLEPTPELFVQHMVAVFREVRRVLRSDGVMFINIGDCYASQGGPEPAQTKWQVHGASDGQAGGCSRAPANGLKPKDLVMIPARLALALQADGWWLRSRVIWHKRNCMPSSAADRPTVDYEEVLLLSKSATYHWDAEACREPSSDASNGRYLRKRATGHKYDDGRGWSGDRAERWNEKAKTEPIRASRNFRTTWDIPTKPSRERHFASFPIELPARCIVPSTSEAGCCPTCGAALVRILGKPEPVEARGSGNLRRRTASGVDMGRLNTHMGYSIPWKPGVKETLGWRMTCKCPYGTPVQAVVLDPFAGTGTTLAAALMLGRRAVGIDLSEPYAEMARRRLAQVRPDPLLAARVFGWVAKQKADRPPKKAKGQQAGLPW